MLDHMFSGPNVHGHSFPFTAFEGNRSDRWSARILRTNLRDTLRVQRTSLEHHSEERESILTSIADLMSVWQDVMTEIAETGIDILPPWKVDSTRSHIMSRLLELEIRESAGQLRNLREC